MLTVQDIVRDPVGFLRRVEAGESLIVTRSDSPVAEVKPLTRPKRPRPVGLADGEFVVPDDFDSPLPETVLRDFYGP